MKNGFNVGDRVKVNGKAGVVRHISEDAPTILVEFDEFVHGHAGRSSGKEYKDGHCWWYNPEAIEKICPDKLIFKGKETILIKDGKEYVSKCQDGDVYDKEKGVLLCLARANGVSYSDLRTMIDAASYEPTDEQAKAVKDIAERMKVFFEAGFKALKERDKASAKPEAEKTVKEVKRPAKVGEYIKLVDDGALYSFDKVGDIHKVRKLLGTLVYVEKHDHAYAIGDYVVLENYKPYKITLSEFWKSEDELAIHCKTEDEAKELLKAFDKAGKEWHSGSSYTSHTNYEHYGKETAYTNGCGYSELSFFKKEGYKIYEFNEVDMNN
jgi:hypothetical protein